MSGSVLEERGTWDSLVINIPDSMGFFLFFTPLDTVCHWSHKIKVFSVLRGLRLLLLALLLLFQWGVLVPVSLSLMALVISSQTPRSSAATAGHLLNVYEENHADRSSFL